MGGKGEKGSIGWKEGVGWDVLGVDPRATPFQLNNSLSKK